MKMRKFQFVICFLMFLNTGSAFGFSTHSVTVSREFDKLEAAVNDPITVTLTFSNLDSNELRGFYYVDQIPAELAANTVSVQLDGSNVSNYTAEPGSTDDVYFGCVPHRWILETPTDFAEGNPVPQNSTVEIVYALTSSVNGSFDLNEFSWVGYYPLALEEEQGAFGHSEVSDEQTLTYLLACKGNFDGDGDVEGTDFATFAADFGRTDCAGSCLGDFDLDGDVDGSDLVVFAADFGRSDCP